MSKITLSQLGSLQNETTALAVINGNSDIIETAFDNTLSRDGTQPNVMEADIDMNSNRVMNLPVPVNAAEPLRLQDLTTFINGGTVTNIPAGGTTNQVLAKVDDTDYNVQWSSESANVIAGTNITVTGGSPVTVATVTNPTFTNANLITPTIGAATATSINKMGITAPATASTLAVADGKTFTASNTMTLAAAADGLTFTLPTGGGTMVSLSATQTLTNKTLTAPTLNTPTLTAAVLGTPTSGTLTNCTGYTPANLSGIGAGMASFITTPSSANLATTVTDETGTGSLVFATTPTLITPVLGAATATTINGSVISPGHYTGEPSTGSAVAGQIGEEIETILTSGSATSLTTATPKNITGITLTAGDWDVTGYVYFVPAGTTSITQLISSVSITSGALDTTPGRFFAVGYQATVPGVTSITQPAGLSRFSLASTTTVILVASATFTISTMVAYGIIRARRIR